MFTSISSARRVATIIKQNSSNKHYLPSVSHSLHHSYCLFEELPQQCVSNFYHFYHCGVFSLLLISQEYSHSSEFYLSSLQIIFQHKPKKTKQKKEKEIPFCTFCLVSPLTNSSEQRGWMEALCCCSKRRAHYFTLNQISVKQ